MDRRGFFTKGLAAGIAGLSASSLSAEAKEVRPGPWWSPRSSELDGVLRLNSNENPLGVSPAARTAVLDALDEANRYPRDRRAELISKLAGVHGVSESQVVLGAGSTEILQMAVQAYEAPGARLVIADPTFEDVPRYQEPFAYDLVRVPLTAEYAHDLDPMRAAAEEGDAASVVYVCNPNNPTGTLTPSNDIEAWIRSAPETTLFLVDEAYLEYALDPSYRSALPLIDDYPNVVVVRTFSKIFGMAGLRLGFGLAHADTAQRLRDFIASNNANQLALAAALASLDDAELVQRSLAANDAALAIARATLAELDLEMLPSHTNFVMHRINGDLDAYQARMRERDILVGRDFPPMMAWNRLSLGLVEEMATWADALRDFRKRGWV